MNFTRTLSLVSISAFFSILFLAHGFGFAQMLPSTGAGKSLAIFSSKFSITEKQEALFFLHGYIHGLTPKFYTKIRQEVEIESLDSLVIIRKTILKDDIQMPLVLTFEQYRELTREQTEQNAWRDYIVRELTEELAKARGPGGINLEIPVKIKSKTFQKIFGSGNVGLTVTGNISINMSLRREDRSEVRTAITRGANTNFKMEQKQRFSVTGKIGDKVTVNVDQDSERAFDFDNNVRLVYQGYDDEILQKLEAGNISLSLPGTRYVTFSGKNAGLFGIKSQMVFGNLNLTTIASQEKGESKRLSLTGGAQAGGKIVRDYQYLRNTYFFLDFTFRQQYPRFNAQRTHLSLPANVSPVDGDAIEVYIASPRNDTDHISESIRGWATLSGLVTSPQDTAEVQPGIAENGFFIRVEKNEYYVEKNLGWIRMNNRVADGDILAVAYRTENGEEFGDIATDSATGPIILKLIKSRNPHPKIPTAKLEWRHVYPLGGRGIDRDGFDIKIFFEPASGVPQETNTDTRRWLTVFGLDAKDKNGNLNPDGEIDLDPNFVDLTNGELHFPDLRPFDPEGYTVDGQIDTGLTRDLREPAIYDTTTQSVINAQSRFYIDIKSQSRSSDYNLGFNVIEGSEVVTLNGRQLRNRIDYTIDYFSGRLTVINQEALNPSAQLDISYERNQLFQLAKKTILGIRAEYELGRDSFIGGTFLYLNQTTLDRKVRVGQGPMRNLVWDINTRLKLRPNFIGRALDLIPLIRANGETSLSLEGEIAQVLPTPNTLNNANTGDNAGVAYIDDFEGSKKTVNLGVIRRNWTQASEPADTLHTFKNMLNNMVWYNPFGQVFINDIYPERELNPNVPNRVHVLRMDLFPDTNDPNPDPNTWGGIMRALSPGIFDQTQTKFIEIMVQGTTGRLHIDLGTMSEDVIPNGFLDTEDDAAGLTRNGILDPGEDIGIDGVEKPDPPDLNFPRSMFAGQNKEDVPYDFWDVGDSLGIKEPDEPWSYDDWFYSEASIDYIVENPYGSIVGTENSTNDQGGRRPDTEDINGNGFLDRANSYFQFSFSLSDDHADTTFIVGGNPNNPPELGGPWKLYRIPFITSDPSSKFRVGSPSATQIEFARIWIDSLGDTGGFARATIAEINLVGSEWKELGTADNEFDPAGIIPGDTTVTVAQINTHENAAYAETLDQIGVQGEEDRVTGVRAREQALVLVANSLKTGQSGLAQKSLFRGENYIRYDRIKMFVHGDTTFTAMSHIPASSDTASSSNLEYFIRFGADGNNYYEYRSRIYSGWNDKNHMDTGIQDFTTLDTLFNNGTEFDTLNSVFVKSLSPDNSKSIRKKGNPSFTNIKVLTLGLKNLHPTDVPFTGEIWFNELRLSDVENDKGMAMRVRADLNIADFITINSEVEKKDADFHNVATRFGTGNNSLSSNVSASVKLDKMLPQSWGLAMPLTLNFRNSNSTPKYVPGQDRLVTDDLPQSELDRTRTRSSQSGFNFSFRKVTKSKNFFVKHTADNISFSLGRTKSDLKNPSLSFSNLRAWTGNLDYNLTFGRNNFFKPFGWLPNLPLIGKVKETKFYYTPQNVSFKLNGAKRNQMTQNRVLNSAQAADTTATETFTIDRSARANMKILESLSIDISRLHKADMRGKTFSDFINNKFSDINVTQSFSTRYNPRIFDWLNNNFTYSSNYTFARNIQQQTTGRSARVSSNKSADFTFKWKDFARSVFGVGKKKTNTGGRRGRQNPNSQPLLIFQEKDEGVSFNPLKLFGSFLSKFKDIRFNYSERTNRTHLGLVPGAPSLAFQFGLSDTTNLSSVSGLTTNTISSTDNQSYTASSGLAFGRAIDVALKFQHSEQRNQSTNISGNSSNSWVKFRQFDLPFPEWTVRIGGLSSLPLFKSLFKSVTFSHSFSGQRDVTWDQTSDNETRRSFTTNFRPLGKLDLNFKNGFTGNIQINNSKTLSQTLTTGGENQTENTDISVTTNYSKRSGFRIPIWPFNNKELKNSIDFSFTFTASTSSRKNKAPGKSVFEEQDSTTRWSVSPRLTYSFSNQVRGGAFLEIGKTDSKRIGKTSIQEFGLDINIAISGR